MYYDYDTTEREALFQSFKRHTIIPIFVCDLQHQITIKTDRCKQFYQDYWIKICISFIQDNYVPFTFIYYLMYVFISRRRIICVINIHKLDRALYHCLIWTFWGHTKPVWFQPLRMLIYKLLFHFLIYMYILLTFKKAVLCFHIVCYISLYSIAVPIQRQSTGECSQDSNQESCSNRLHMAPDRGIPLDVWLSGYNTENLPCTIMGNVLGECHAPDMLKTSFVDVGKIVHAL